MVGDGGRRHPNESPDATLHVITGPPWRWRQQLPAWPSPPVGVVGADRPLALAAPTATALGPATIDPPPTSGAPFTVLAPLAAPVLLASRPLTLTLDASAWVTAGWLDPARGWLVVTADVHADADVPDNRQHTRAVSGWQRAADGGWRPLAADDPALRRHVLAQLTSPTFPWDDWTIRRCFADSARLLTKGLVWETVGGPIPTTADDLAGWAPWVDAAGRLHVVREVQPPDGAASVRLRAMVRWLTSDRDLAVILLHRLDEQRVLARARYAWAAHCAPVTRHWTLPPLADARLVGLFDPGLADPTGALWRTVLERSPTALAVAVAAHWAVAVGPPPGDAPVPLATCLAPVPDGAVLRLPSLLVAQPPASRLAHRAEWSLRGQLLIEYAPAWREASRTLLVQARWLIGQGWQGGDQVAVAGTAAWRYRPGPGGWVALPPKTARPVDSH